MNFKKTHVIQRFQLVGNVYKCAFGEISWVAICKSGILPWLHKKHGGHGTIYV